MDNAELEFLKQLEYRIRPDLTQLAALQGISKDEIFKRVTALEEAHIINGYSAVIDWEQVDIPLVRALIEVKVNPEPEVGFDRIAHWIADYEEVVDVILASGTYDLLVTVQGTDMRHIAAFVAQKLAALDAVQSATTHFVLKNYKKDGFICGGKENDRRLVIQL